MTRDEWNQLAATVYGMWEGSGDAQSFLGSSAGAADSVNPASATAQTDGARLLQSAANSSSSPGDIERLAQSAATAESELAARRDENVRPSKSTQTSQNSGSGDSTAATVLKTAGMVTGVGPLVTGLLSLFGGSDDKPEQTPLVQYTKPDAIGVDAGLAADRSLVSIAYGQNGQPRSTSPNSSAQGAQIQVNVQAMDSRSFLDHSDDIAQAVRNAMLRSHSLNDIVSEI